MNKNIQKFGLINTVEGYSYLLLLFVAMPLKYILGFSVAVKIAGMIHGILFIIFLVLGVKAWVEAKWSLYQTVIFCKFFFTGCELPHQKQVCNVNLIKNI